MKTLFAMSFALLIAVVQVCAQTAPEEKPVFEGTTYPIYPTILSDKPNISSPFTTSNGRTYVVGLTAGGGYSIFPVTVENGAELNYEKNIWHTKGRQLDVDSVDFSSLAETGLHAQEELDRTIAITGRSVEEITRIGHPRQYSGIGFMAEDEDIISVLAGDNVLVRSMNMTHPDLALPLFHVFNVIQNVVSQPGYHKRGGTQTILYNGSVVNLKFWGAKGWQESIFNDEILGYWEIEISRELNEGETEYLYQWYSNLSDEEYSQMLDKLSHIHTGEMAAFYAMRYGFYEGHTGYRADPIAIAFIFGLQEIRDIDGALGKDLHAALTTHHTSEDTVHSSCKSNE